MKFWKLRGSKCVEVIGNKTTSFIDVVIRFLFIVDRIHLVEVIVFSYLNVAWKVFVTNFRKILRMKILVIWVTVTIDNRDDVRSE